MAFFGVTIETIELIKDHPNADRLKICKLAGMDFQFIIGKDMPYRNGDRVLYFPIDSLLPLKLMRLLDMIKKDEHGNELFDDNGKPKTMLSGKDGNRIKTVRLRSEISEGVVAPLTLLYQYLDPDIEKYKSGFDLTPENITSLLGVEKYEPPVLFDANADLVGLPCSLSVYDIEGADRYPEIAEELMDLPVLIFEKLEGMNLSVTYDGIEDKIYVNQRSYSIRPKEGAVHSFWKTAEQHGFLEFIKEIYNTVYTDALAFNAATPCAVTLYGEFCGEGIQGNIYKLKGHKIFPFDIKVDNRFINAEYFLALCNNKVEIAPIISHGLKLKDVLSANGKTLKEFSNGKSQLADVLREGIVIKPMAEKYCPRLGGRLILKQRSSLYLCQSEN